MTGPPIIAMPTPPGSGEMIAAVIAMIMTAYLKLRIMKRGVISPIFARNSTNVGSWNVSPIQSISRRYHEKAGSMRGMNVTKSIDDVAKNFQMTGNT